MWFMKKAVLYILSVVLLSACQEQIDDTSQLKDEGTLEVSFAYGGNNNVKHYTFTPSGQSVDIEVKMNVEVGWMVSSNVDWCVVDEEDVHHGNGTFKLAVKPNDGFQDRDDATVTLSSGDFKTTMRVTQYGNVFIVDKEYQLSNNVAGTTELNLKVREGVEWSIDCPEWITVSQGDPIPEGGQVNTVITLAWDANRSVSRFGTVGFVRDGDKDASISFSLFQFGNEYTTTEDGTIILDAEKPTPVEVRVPINTFTDIDCPKWVTYEPPVANEDNTESWYLYFAENPSDTETLRNAEIGFTTTSSDDVVFIPVITQNFYPAGGLLTAAGFKMFAERFNSGGDISSWVNNGAVNIVGHVDMSGLDEWTPIGTEDRPFNLKFDGRFMTISNFKYSSPLFGVCNCADISGVVFDQTCSVERNQDFVSDRYLAPLAQQLINTQVRDCESDAFVGLNASAVTEGCNVYMSCLVACSDELSTIKDCIVGGSIVTRANKGTEKGSLYIGGLVAKSMGSIEPLDNDICNVSISDSLTVASRYIGGLVGYVGNDLELDLTGTSALQSNINISPASDVYVGGIIGYAASGLKLKAPSWSGNITYNISTDNVVSQTGVSGMVGYSAASLDVDGASVSGEISVKANNSKTYAGAISLGGVVAIASDGADIRNSHNSSKIAWTTHCANSNGHVSSVGGIAGRIDKGIANIEECTNSGYLLNGHVNNNGYSKGQLKGDRIGGIVGYYGLDPKSDKQTSNITIQNCHNTADLNSKRGFCGGIAGFLVNASVKNCSFTGNITKDHSNPYAAGIVAGAERSTIQDCDVTASLYGQYQGSCYVRVGGVVAILYDSSSIQGCRYFGNITGTAGGTPRYGCIAGDVEAGCSISKCGMGGILQGTEVTTANFDKYIYGLQFPSDGPLTIPDGRPEIQITEPCYYWNGIKGNE